MCVEYLMDLRSYYQNREIISILRKHGVKISGSILSRYLRGRMMPSIDKSLAILQAFESENILRETLEKILVVNRDGIINIPYIAFSLPILRMASCHAWLEYRDKNIEHVLTAAVNGIPLSTLVAEKLNARLAVAKQSLDAGITRYLETKYIAPNPPRYQTLYIPYYALKPQSNVLIVDDLLFSGRTLGALIGLAKKIHANIKGVFSLIAMGDNWRIYLKDCPNAEVHIILEKNI